MSRKLVFIREKRSRLSYHERRSFYQLRPLKSRIETTRFWMRLSYMGK